MDVNHTRLPALARGVYTAEICNDHMSSLYTTTQVSLNSVFLWTDIILPEIPLQWANQFIARSVEAPLSFKFLVAPFRGDDLRDEDHAIQSIISGCRLRLQNMCVNADSYPFPLSVLLEAFPALESAHLSVSGWNNRLPENFFHQAPQLRSLEITGLLIPWNASILGHLTHLKLVDHRGYSCSEELTIPNANAIFQRLHALETLTTEGLLPVVLNDRFTSDTQLEVRLPPSLLHYNVTFVISPYAQQHVRCLVATSKHTRMTLHVHPSYDDDEELLFLPSLKQWFVRHTCPRPEAMAISVLSPPHSKRYGLPINKTLSLAVRRSRWPNSLPHQSLPLNDYEVIWKMPAKRSLMLAHPAFYGVNVEDVVDLYLHISPPQDPEVWFALFSDAKNIRRLYMDRHTAFDIFQAIVPLPLDDSLPWEYDDSPLTSSYLPRLQSLCIVDNAVDEDHAPERRENDLLTEFLRERNGSGRRLRDVQLPRRWDVAGWVDEIRKLVDVVRWSQAGFY
ncbi:hypothetical protein OF83DRAFT_156854 [Amylostereum chailletii]|nr:hypothetical protein OF83DRAFT_156854 [Amylostereum chailletii]